MAPKGRGKNPAQEKITRVTVRCHGPLFTRLDALARVLGPGFAPTTVARLALIEGLPALEARYLGAKPPQAPPQRTKPPRAQPYGDADEDAAAAALGAGDGTFVAPRISSLLDDVPKVETPAIDAAISEAVAQEHARMDAELAATGQTTDSLGRAYVLDSPAMSDVVATMDDPPSAECPHGVRFDAFTPCQECALMPPAPDVPEDDGDVTVINVGTETDPGALLS